MGFGRNRGMSEIGRGFLVVCLFWAVAGTGAVLAQDGDEAPGQQEFLAAKCNLCHGVEAAGIEAKTKSEKMAGGDLSDVASQMEMEAAIRYVKREEQRDGQDHKKEWKGTDEELQAIMDWLYGLKAAEGGEG